MSKFQLIVTGIFAGLIVIGVIIFSIARSGTGGPPSSVTIWGTYDRISFEAYLQEIFGGDDAISVTYQQKRAATFESELLEALASGKGPDVIFLPHDFLYQYRNLLYPIPYETYSERAYLDTFVGAGEIFMGAGGIYGLPFMIDPLILYWNRDILESEGIAAPPRYWHEFVGLSERLSRKDEKGNLVRSTVAFGEFVNVSHAKDILSLLFLQAGNPLVQRTGTGFLSLLNEKLGQELPPVEAALRFYTDFANPSKSLYSWNRSLPISESRFLSGDLAFYIGFASEVEKIKQKNPNLNYDVVALPQLSTSKNQITYADLTALALTKNVKNYTAALRVITELTSADAEARLVRFTKLPPTRRDLLSVLPKDPYLSIFYGAAVRARSWLDPDPESTANIFQSLVETVTGGRARIGEAMVKANNQLQGLFK